MSRPPSFAGIRQLNRINIVGSSGSGKSTFGRALAQKLGHPYIETDEVFWRPDWTEPPDDEFYADLEQRLAGDCWVLDGNYGRTVPIKWRRVEAVIWLDLPYWLILWQVISRTIRRSVTAEELWAGNREDLVKAFFSRDSVIYWSLTNLRRVRRRYLAAMTSPRFSHIRFIRLRSRREVRALLADL